MHFKAIFQMVEFQKIKSCLLLVAWFSLAFFGGFKVGGKKQKNKKTDLYYRAQHEKGLRTNFNLIMQTLPEL